MKLHKFHILIWESCSRYHCIPIPSTSMSTGTRKVGPSITTSCQHCVLCKHAMQCAILHTQTQHARTSPINHQQVQRKILNEKIRIMLQRLSIQSMQHGMPSPVRSTSSSMRLATLAIL